MSAAIEVEHLTHCYGRRRAIDDLSLQIEAGEIFALLGPNGGGKTTLFRVLSTLIPLQQGAVRIFGRDVRREAHAVRSSIGVVFQAPSLDKKLTVAENVRHQGHLYGLTGRALAQRQEEMLDRLRLTDRRGDLVETLSGGLRRRVELAKGMLHRPRLLLMDEPSTGLDPGARGDLWDYLWQIRGDDGVTAVLTTHLLEEAERADRIAILHEGSLVALDSPEALRATVGGDTITILADDAAGLAGEINERLGGAPRVVDGTIRLEQADGPRWIARLMEIFGDRIDTITLGKPTLEDVFIARTGHRLYEEPSKTERP